MQAHLDLIYAFSVFTHLSERAAIMALTTLRRYVARGGLFVITIRPKEYWDQLDRVARAGSQQHREPQSTGMSWSRGMRGVDLHLFLTSERPSMGWCFTGIRLC